MIEKDDADIAIGNFVEFNNHNGTTLFHIMDDANKLKKFTQHRHGLRMNIPTALI